MKRTYVLFASSFRYEAAPNISHLTEDRIKTLCGRSVSSSATVEDDNNDLDPDCRVCDRVMKARAAAINARAKGVR